MVALSLGCSVFQAVTEEKFCILFQSNFDVGGKELSFQVWVSNSEIGYVILS